MNVLISIINRFYITCISLFGIGSGLQSDVYKLWLQCAASVVLYGRSGETSPLLPPLCTFLHPCWHSLISAFPNPPRWGSRLKSG